jgi:predicted permease
MWTDLRFAFKTLKRSPGFALTAVLSLALGIGANTAIFSLLYQVVLRSQPIQNPQTLVSLESDDNNFGWTRRDNNRTVFSYPMYRELRDRNQALRGLIARSSFPATLAYHGDAIRASAEVVSGNFFDVLGVRPALGRVLSPADDGVPGENPAIVLSHSYWASKLGADPRVLNSQILMNGHPVTVVGIAPPEFRGVLAGNTPEFFAPISMMQLVAPGWTRSQRPDAYWLSVFGRLRPGVGEARANAMLGPLFHAIWTSQIPQMESLDEESRLKILAKPLTLRAASQGLNGLRDQWQTPLLVLSVMVGLVLLVACANVANLLIARATSRQKEIAVRLAVGATGWILARQLMVESVILALAGGLAGLVLSLSLTSGLLALLPVDAAGGWLSAQPDIRLLWYSLALSLLTGLLFGLVPALQAMRASVAAALKEQTGGMSASGSHARMRQVLVVAQICLSLLLLVGAGLFTRSLINLAASDPGFRQDRLVTFALDPSLSGLSSERSRAIFRQLSERLNSLPGVRSAAIAEFPPFGGWGWGTGAKAPGTRNANDKYVSAGENSVGPGYFRTMGIPLLAGREFTESDSAAAPKVAILNQTFARYLFDDANAVGRHIITGDNDADLEIVGVAKDSKYGGVREQAERFLYVPYEQGGPDFVRRAAFLVWTQGGESGMMTALRQAVREVDPNLPIERLAALKVMVGNSIYTDRLIATLALAFGVLAAILAAVGLYGTVAYSVARRTREFGIRLVLGAAPGSLLASVMRSVGWLTAIGVVLGLPVAYWLARMVESQFFGIRAHDPWVLAGATLGIAGVALAAGLVPAVRAARMDAIRALRYE